MSTRPSHTTNTATGLRSAAGPGYAGEWALFCDYTTATDQPTLPTSVDALVGFLTALPAAPGTTARRVRAIAASHRHAGHLLARPDTGPAAPPTRRSRISQDPGLLIAACPTRGWPHGLWGRRDAFLVVLTEILASPHRVARDAAVGDLAFASDAATWTTAPQVRGRAVPADPDPRRCPACAVVRWLDILGLADGLGRGTARMHLTVSHGVTADNPHQHLPAEPARWHGAPVLLPAIDQHGFHDDYRPMTTRAIRTRLALAVARTSTPDSAPVNDGLGVTAGTPSVAPAAAGSKFGLEEVLIVLDELADDVDALNARIQALLDR